MVVRVPVLSKQTMSALPISSRNRPPLIRILRRAAALMAALTAVDAARTVAQGQAMTSMTVKARHRLPVKTSVAPVARKPTLTVAAASLSATPSMGARFSRESSTWGEHTGEIGSVAPRRAPAHGSLPGGQTFRQAPRRRPPGGRNQAAR